MFSSLPCTLTLYIIKHKSLHWARIEFPSRLLNFYFGRGTREFKVLPVQNHDVTVHFRLQLDSNFMNHNRDETRPGLTRAHVSPVFSHLTSSLPARLRHGGFTTGRPAARLHDRQSFKNPGALRPVQEGMSGRRRYEGKLLHNPTILRCLRLKTWIHEAVTAALSVLQEQVWFWSSFSFMLAVNKHASSKQTVLFITLLLLLTRSCSYMSKG